MEAIIGGGTPPAGNADLVKNGTTATFMADVIDASHDAAVVVDFWAPWCGPCKQLGPQLEKAVRGAKGAVRMVKINIDENQELAAQMRIQSIPAVYAFKDGRPVDGFVGAVPESQVKQFVGKLTAGAGAADSPIAAAVALAKEASSAGDHPRAANIFAQVLQHEPENFDALTGLARIALAKKDLKQAREILAKIPAEQAKHADVVAIRTGLELAETGAKAAGAVDELQGAARARSQGSFGAARAGLGALRRRRPRSRDRSTARSRQARPRMERAGGAQATGQILRGDRARRSVDGAVAQASFVDPVLMSFEPRIEDLPALLPIFPLTGALLLPRGRLPLNIFEPRYLAMVQHALGQGRMIGMIQPQEGAGDAGDPPIYRTGCAGRIVEFAETPDGRFILTLKGVARFEVASEPPRTALFRQVVPDWQRWHDDLQEDNAGVDRERMVTALKPFFERHGINADSEVLTAAPIEHLVNSLAMACPFSPSEKQAFLEAPRTGERAKILTALVEMSVASTVTPNGGARN